MKRMAMPLIAALAVGGCAHSNGSTAEPVAAANYKPATGPIACKSPLKSFTVAPPSNTITCPTELQQNPLVFNGDPQLKAGAPEAMGQNTQGAQIENGNSQAQNGDHAQAVDPNAQAQNQPMAEPPPGGGVNDDSDAVAAQPPANGPDQNGQNGATQEQMVAAADDPPPQAVITTKSGVKCVPKARPSVDESCCSALIHFGFDSAELDSTSKAVLDKTATCLGQKEKMQVTIVGNADQRGSEKYNLALGQRRADAVAGYLADKGIAKEQLVTSSRGKDDLVCDQLDLKCTAINRRTQIAPENIASPAARGLDDTDQTESP